MPQDIPRIAIAPPAKSALSSRTIWLNVIVLLLAGVEGQLGLLQPLLPVDVFAVIAAALPLANIALRWVTRQPLALRPGAQAGMPDEPPQ